MFTTRRERRFRAVFASPANMAYKAVEEALSNAVYHKSYRTPEPITVMVTPDRMEITSIPGPDRTITDEDMRNWHFVVAETAESAIS